MMDILNSQLFGVISFFMLVSSIFIYLSIKRANREFKKITEGLPGSIFLKIDPWWRCLLPARKKKIHFKKHLSGEPVHRYRITSMLGIEIVERHPSDPIMCSGCSIGEFKPTGLQDQTNYEQILSELWQCTWCGGKISVCLYKDYGVKNNAFERLFNNNLNI